MGTGGISSPELGVRQGLVGFWTQLGEFSSSWTDEISNPKKSSGFLPTQTRTNWKDMPWKKTPQWNPPLCWRRWPMTLLTDSAGNPRGDTTPGLSVREFLDSVHWGGKSHPELDSIFQGWSCSFSEKAKAGWATGSSPSASLYWCCDKMPHTAATRPGHHKGLLTCDARWTFPFKLLFFDYLVTARKVANIQLRKL